MTILEIIAIIRDIFISLAAIITAFVATIGFKNWKRELKGKAEFEIARGLIRATYKLRDELQGCRSSFFSANEFSEGYQGASSESSPEEKAQAREYVYRNPWKPVRDALQEFEAHALEAEALWGNEIRSKTNEFLQCVRELSNAIFAVIQDKASGGEDFKSDKNFAKKMRAKVYASGDENGELSQKITNAVNGIEKEVRPHLRRSS